MRNCYLGVFLLSIATEAFGHQAKPPGASEAREKTIDLIASLNGEQKKISVFAFGDPKLKVWGYVPKSRSGISLHKLEASQRKLVFDVLKSVLSAKGLETAKTIMSLERILEKEEFGFIRRDPLGYFLEVFGEPSESKAWALSFEGHHLSLNFVFKNNKVIRFSPLFVGANPSHVKQSYGVGPKKGTSPLSPLEKPAFRLVKSLNKEQLKKAHVAKEARDDIDKKAEKELGDWGLSCNKLNPTQRSNLNELLQNYLSLLPESFVSQGESSTDSCRFIWTGSLKPGVGHHYRIETSGLIIELANTQSDVSGNPANHIHALLSQVE